MSIRVAGYVRTWKLTKIFNIPITYDGSYGHHGTAAAIEFAVLSLHVSRIVVCGHSHCGAIKALYEEMPAEANNLRRWLDLGRLAALPVVPTPAALRRTEQRAVVLRSSA